MLQFDAFLVLSTRQGLQLMITDSWQAMRRFMDDYQQSIDATKKEPSPFQLLSSFAYSYPSASKGRSAYLIAY